MVFPYNERSGSQVTIASLERILIDRFMFIDKQYESVIRRFVHLAHERYPHDIEKIILYGSVARGDAGPGFGYRSAGALER